jgi:hypothetical protein
VKKVSTDQETITFELDSRERDALVHVLQLYPVVPADHHSGSTDTEQQRIIHEALVEHRAANKRQVTKWLSAPDRFEKYKAKCRFTLRREEIEWFLQVINDVRVGNWLLLGSPELQDVKPDELSAEKLPRWFAMELAGYFQMSVLEALG